MSVPKHLQGLGRGTSMDVVRAIDVLYSGSFARVLDSPTTDEEIAVACYLYEHHGPGRYDWGGSFLEVESVDKNELEQ